MKIFKKKTITPRYLPAAAGWLVMVMVLFFFTQQVIATGMPPMVVHPSRGEYVSSIVQKAMVGSTGTQASYLAVDDSGRVKISGDINLGSVTINLDVTDALLGQIYVNTRYDSTGLAALFAQSVGQQSRDSSGASQPYDIASYTRLREIADKDSSISRLVFSADSLLILIKGYQATIAGLSNDIYGKVSGRDSSIVANISTHLLSLYALILAIHSEDSSGVSLPYAVSSYNRLRDIVVRDSELVVTSYSYLKSVDSVLAYISDYVGTSHIEGCDVLVDTFAIGGGTIKLIPTPWTSGLYNQKTIFINKDIAGSVTDSVYIIGSWTPVINDASAYAYRNVTTYGFLMGQTTRFMISIPPIYLPYLVVAIKNNNTGAAAEIYSVRACGKSNHGE